jgi:hypothetical protein
LSRYAQAKAIKAQASISPSRTSTFNEFPINSHNDDCPKPTSPKKLFPDDKALTRGTSSTMVLEAVMVVVDNSESSRNGDYTPTRFEAQSDAVSLIFSAITQANPESSVGLMSMGGKGPEVLVTLTTDHGKILEGLHRTKSKIRGDSHLTVAIQIAQVRILPRSLSRAERKLTAGINSSPSSTVKMSAKGNNVS